MSARTFLRLALVQLALLACPTPAQALLFRAYLSVNGSDANPCTLPAPCRLLPAALAAVASGGEIWMLDSANFNTGPVTVDKSVTILAVPGAVGSVVATGDGSAISIALSGLTVALRNLAIVPVAGTLNQHGVYMTGDSSLTVENCLIANVAGRGIYLSGAGGGALKVANSIIRNVGVYGVQLSNGGRAEISGTQLLHNSDGAVFVYATAGTSSAVVTVSDSVVSGGYYGVWTYANIPGGAIQVTVTRSTIEGTERAVQSQVGAGGSALVALSGSTIANNSYGWTVFGGAVVKSFGNNHIAENSSGNSGALTPAALQ
jgi:hypothetical protein